VQSPPRTPAQRLSQRSSQRPSEQPSRVPSRGPDMPPQSLRTSPQAAAAPAGVGVMTLGGLTPPSASLSPSPGNLLATPLLATPLHTTPLSSAAGRGFSAGSGGRNHRFAEESEHDDVDGFSSGTNGCSSGDASGLGIQSPVPGSLWLSPDPAASMLSPHSAGPSQPRTTSTVSRVRDAAPVPFDVDTAAAAPIAVPPGAQVTLLTGPPTIVLQSRTPSLNSGASSATRR
jgi:hypothetical protein